MNLLAALLLQDQIIRLGTLAPDGSVWHSIIRDMADNWTKASGNRIQVKIFAGGVAGDEPDSVRKMRGGLLHAAALTGVGLAEITPEIMALQMPMLLQTYDELDYVMEKIAPRLEELLDKKGFIVLNWGDAGWVRFFAQSPVVTPDDLKKHKLFVWASSTTEAGAWKDAGYTPVPLAVTEIHTGLKSGLITAFPTTPLAALSFQWFGSAQNMADMNWAPLVGATLMTKKKWQTIPADQQPAVLKAARDAGLELKKKGRQMGDEAVDVMKKHGLVVHPVPPDARAQWEKAARSVYPTLMKQGIPAELVAEVERLRDERRKGR